MTIRRLRAVALATFLLLTSAIAGIAQTPEPPEYPRPGVVIGDTPMYWFRDLSREPIRTLAAGTRVEVLGREGEWYRVVFHDGRYGDDVGYISLSSLEFRDDGENFIARALSQRGFFEGRGVFFPQDALNDDVNAVGDLLVRDEVFVKPARWVQFSAGADLRGNTHDQVEDEFRLDFTDRGVQRPLLSVRRLTATVRGSHLSIEAGKQFIRWGRADVLNPTDRFAPRDYLNVFDSDFLAVTGVRPSLRLGNETLEGVWVPRLTPSRVPLIDQRWTVLPPEAAGITIEDRGSVFPGGGQYGARWTHAGGRVEGGLSFFNGFNHLPDVEIQPLEDGTSVALTRTYPKLRTFGADLAVPTHMFTFKSEMAAFVFPANPEREQYVLLVVELERQIGEWLLDGGYAADMVTRGGVDPSYGIERGTAKSFIGRASYTVNPRRSVTIEGALRQTGKGAYVKGEFTQTHGRHWRVTVAGVGIAGSDTDFLGQFHRNSNVTAAARFSF